jgi:hypothetical protein
MHFRSVTRHGSQIFFILQGLLRRYHGGNFA